MNSLAMNTTRLLSLVIPKWPLLIWLVAIALLMGLASGLNAGELIRQFDASFSRSLGEFALILLPSFVLAAAMSRQNLDAVSGITVGVSPFAGAGMICASTAYAALAPAAGMRRLDVAFGVHAGFKLLYPAGPLIVATGLGVEADSLLVFGFILLIPVWFAGTLWIRLYRKTDTKPGIPETPQSLQSMVSTFSPFLLLAGLIIVGALRSFPNTVLLEFITQPKGALMLAASLALLRVTRGDRRECIDTAILQTGELILIIGIAGAFGGMLTQLVPLSSLMPAQSGLVGIISLFLLAVMFKLAQGGSMTVFVTVAPVAASIVQGMDISPVVAVYSICLGTFVAILPNDSFYWLVRRDALIDHTDARAVAILAGGAALQALIGLTILIVAAEMGVV